MQRSKKVIRIAALGVALCISSCSKNNDATPEPKDEQVKFTSSIGPTQTRVGGTDGTEWDGDEVIGIYMVETGSTTVVGTAANIAYKATSAGMATHFEAVTASQLIYYPDAGSIDFIAYYPYTTTVSNYSCPVNVGTQTSQSAIDLMFATANNNGAGYDKDETNPVGLLFYHQLSNVVIKLTAGEGVNDLSGLQATIKGMNTTADFDLTGTAGLTNVGTPADIDPLQSAEACQAILLPVTLDASHSVEFTIGGESYTWAMLNNTGATPGSNPITRLEPGKKYTFHITLQKSSLVATGTIEAWGNEPDVNGIAQ